MVTPLRRDQFPKTPDGKVDMQWVEKNYCVQKAPPPLWERAKDNFRSMGDIILLLVAGAIIAAIIQKAYPG